MGHVVFYTDPVQNSIMGNLKSSEKGKQGEARKHV